MPSTGFISPTQKEEIRNRVALEDLLRDYNVHLLPAGRKLRGLCPFHQEKTPSFYVDPDKQLYYCYGCHEGGDLFRFVEKMDRLEFPEAVELLARRAGVVLEPVSGDVSAWRRGQERRLELYDVLEAAAAWYHRVLLDDPVAERARQYLARRGIDRDSWRRFRLGYSPPKWDAALSWATQPEGSRRAFSPEALERAGLVRRREGPGGARGDGTSSAYDYFRGRLMFPISDVQDRVIGFGGRTLGDDVPKYLNTPSTSLFDKSRVLYGIAQAKDGIRREERIGIVEGYTDVVMAHQAGLGFFVASLGTAFTRENARSLGRLARKVLIVFDGDSAGQAASERSLDELVGGDLEVSVLVLSGGQDPCDAIVNSGPEAFRRLVDGGSVSIYEFKWQRTVGRLPRTASVEERARSLDAFLHLLLKVSNGVQRRLVLREFAERIDVPQREVEARMRVLAGSARTEPPARERPLSPDAPRETVPESKLPALATLVLDCMVALPDRARDLWDHVPEAVFSSSRPGRVLAEAIAEMLSSGGVDAPRLARDLADPEASRMLIESLARVERSGEGQGRIAAEDWELVWKNCLRDLRRWGVRARVAELRDEMARVRGADDRDSDRFQALRLERNRLLKELKR